MKKVKLHEVVKAVEEIAPLRLQEDWDSSGLTIAFGEKEIGRILTCLEINEEVMEECLQTEADMIVTHHPFIFTGLKAVDSETPEGRMVIEAVKNEICVYSCHTPFDKAPGGNNDSAAGRLGLTSVKNLRGEPLKGLSAMEERRDPADIGRTGRFREPVTFREAIERVLEAFEISLRQIRATGCLDKKVTRVGICTGAGAELITMAAEAGCELFITGDVKYHQARMAEDMGMCLIDAGHYGTEKFFGEDMRGLLDEKFGGVIQVAASKVSLDPFMAL